MTQLVPIALFGWIGVVLVIFAVFPPRRAAIAAVLLGWMFLPEFAYEFRGLPEYGKVTATSVSVLLGALIFDTSRVMAFQPRWWDLPMAVWCFTPFVTSVVNGLGAYDGASVVLDQILLWGVPYFLGRIYIRDWQAVHELAFAVVIGGLIYVPLCLYEVRMSPQLHNMFYGTHPVSFAHSVRFGGYRPMVFMRGGLPVSLWMASASLAGLILWHKGLWRQVLHVPAIWFVGLLWVTTLLCKSVGALALLATGTALYFLTVWFRTRALLAMVVIVMPIYLVVRVGGGWDGKEVITLASQIFPEVRVASLETRIDAEHRLLEAKSHRWLFGWGGWGRARLTDATGKDLAVTDSLWIIAFTENGGVGLIAVYAVLLAPLIVLLRKIPSRELNQRAMAPILALAVSVWMYSMDTLLNAQPNLVLIFTIGGLVTLGVSMRQAAPRPLLQASHEPAHTTAPDAVDKPDKAEGYAA